MSIKRLVVGIQRKADGIKRTGQVAFQPATEAPGVPTFSLFGRDDTITLRIFRPQTGGRPSAYEYQIRRRNQADNGWVSPQAWVETTATTIRITQYSRTIAIEDGQRYQIRVRAKNAIGTSNPTGYMEVIPVATPTLNNAFYANQTRLQGRQYRVLLDNGVNDRGGAEVTWTIQKPTELVNLDITGGNALILSREDSINVPAGAYDFTLTASIAGEVIGTVTITLTIVALPVLRQAFYEPINVLLGDDFTLDLNDGIENKENYTFAWGYANRSGVESPPQQLTLSGSTLSMTAAQVRTNGVGTYSVRMLVSARHNTFGGVSFTPNTVVIMITIRASAPQRQRRGLVDERGYFLTNDNDETLDGE